MSASAPLEYAGDLAAAEAWDLLAREPKAQLVDVRTSAEWNFLSGLPDLTTLARTPHRIEWQIFPGGQQNPDFTARTVEALQANGAGPETPVVFLCRSGARSRAAAAAMTKLGYQKAFNILGGFEGDLYISERHRGGISGWKAAGLPWQQT